MITQIRPKLPGRTFAQQPVSDPLKMNGGAMSFIMHDIEEKLREAVLRGKFEQIEFRVKLTDKGILEYYPMQGPQTRFE